MYQSFLFLADGFEIIEALTVVDVMRRASVDLKTVSIKKEKSVTSAQGVTVIADLTIDEADLDNAQWLILPGGMPGATNLHNCKKLNDAIIRHNQKQGLIAAICAAPAVALAPTGVLKGKKATCYPGFEEALAEGGATATFDRVTECENIITANGPCSAMDFAFAILASTAGEETAANIAAGMLKPTV